MNCVYGYTIRHKTTLTNWIQFSEFIHLASTFGSRFHSIINIGDLSVLSLFITLRYHLFPAFFAFFVFGISLRHFNSNEWNNFGFGHDWHIQFVFQFEYACSHFYWTKSTFSTWLCAHRTVCQLEIESECFGNYIKAFWWRKRSREADNSKSVSIHSFIGNLNVQMFIQLCIRVRLMLYVITD